MSRKSQYKSKYSKAIRKSISMPEDVEIMVNKITLKENHGFTTNNHFSKTVNNCIRFYYKHIFKVL